MTTSDDVPACLACGACCFSRSARYVPVLGSDHARMGDEAADLTVFIGNRCYMRIVDEHCAALRIEASGRYVCSAYELRPAVCRELERGGPSCQAELLEKGSQARQALRVLNP